MFENKRVSYRGDQEKKKKKKYQENRLKKRPSPHTHTKVQRSWLSLLYPNSVLGSKHSYAC